MTASNGYAVFFFPQALEALGGAIAPYLQDSPAGPHVLCNEVDTGGALLEMTIRGRNDAGESVQLELMVPTSMVRMIVSSQSEDEFGFGPRNPDTRLPELPPVGPTGQPAESQSQSVPDSARDAGSPATASDEVPAAKSSKPKPLKAKPSARKAAKSKGKAKPGIKPKRK